MRKTSHEKFVDKKFSVGIATATAGLILTGQLVYLQFATPQLQSPPNTGFDFVKEGISVGVDNDEESEHIKNEIKVALIGDSIIEGLGSNSHEETLGGQTAFALMRLYRRPVRYWSFGKAGLTAGEVEKEMVPLFQDVTKNIDFDVVILSCGTNNLFRGKSWVSLDYSFRDEFESLLDSIENSQIGTDVPIIVLGQFDLSNIPLLPFPLNTFLGYGSSKIHKVMEDSLISRSSKRAMALTKMPSMQRLSRNANNPLLEHIPSNVREKLQHKDFFSHDGFHPADFGTVLLGQQIARLFKQIKSTDKYYNTTSPNDVIQSSMNLH